MTIRFLAESESFKVYSLFESVYLKVKSHCQSYIEYEKSDKCIASVYGDPDSALISFDERYVVVGGCGVIIYNTQTGKSVELFNEPENITWIEGVYQSTEDRSNFVRFNVRTKAEMLSIYRLDIHEHTLELLS